MGESDAVVVIFVTARAIAAPGSDSPLFASAVSVLFRRGFQAELGGEWSRPAGDNSLTGYATATRATRVLAMFSAIWRGGRSAWISGRGTVKVALVDRDGWAQGKTGLISNVVSVDVDCADAGKKK